MPPKTLAGIQTGVVGITERLRALQERIRTEGITKAGGKQLTPGLATQYKALRTQPLAATTRDVQPRVPFPLQPREATYEVYPFRERWQKAFKNIPVVPTQQLESVGATSGKAIARYTPAYKEQKEMIEYRKPAPHIESTMTHELLHAYQKRKPEFLPEFGKVWEEEISKNPELQRIESYINRSYSPEYLKYPTARLWERHSILGEIAKQRHGIWKLPPKLRRFYLEPFRAPIPAKAGYGV